MKDPGPNVLEQQIETNRLLALLLAASGPAPPPAPGSPGLSGGGRCQWPALFSWSNGSVFPFIVTGTSGSYVAISSVDGSFLSHDSAIKVIVAPTTGLWCKMAIGIPTGPLLCPRLQFAWMSNHYPTQCHITAELWYDNGTNLLKAGIKSNEISQDLSYMNSLGAYVQLDTLLYDWHPNYWRKLDLSVNFAEAKYSRAALDGEGFDLSAQGVYPDTTTTRHHLYMTILVTNNSADDPNEVYLDEILVTDGLYTGPEE